MLAACGCRKWNRGNSKQNSKLLTPPNLSKSGDKVLEVTINLISAKTYQPLCSCIAEGQGSTEADDIRIAITRCLASLLN